MLSLFSCCSWDGKDSVKDFKTLGGSQIISQKAPELPNDPVETLPPPDSSIGWNEPWLCCHWTLGIVC